MISTEQLRPIHITNDFENSCRRDLTPFEHNLYNALELSPEQLSDRNNTFTEQVSTIFSPENFLLEDEYTSSHYLAQKVTNNWTKDCISIADTDRLKNPSQSYKSLLLEINPLLEKTNYKLEQENPGKISHTLIQGFIQTEISLREQYNVTGQENIFLLPLNARNTMFFSLSDALVHLGNNEEKGHEMQEGVEITLS